MTWTRWYVSGAMMLTRSEAVNRFVGPRELCGWKALERSRLTEGRAIIRSFMRAWIGHGLLLLVLVVSVLLRVDLVRSGGQSYWPDEIAYDDARAIVAALAKADYASVFVQLDRYGPMLFKV